MSDPKPTVKERWNALPKTQKWLVIGGVGLIALVSAGMSEQQGQQMPQQQMVVLPNGQRVMMPVPQQGPQPGPMQGPQMGPPMMGPNGQPMMPGADGYPQAGGIGGMGGYDGSAGDAQMQQWQESQRSQSQQSKAFNDMIIGQDTIQDGSGQVYTGVDSGTAAAAVDSGSYSYTPTSELPVAGDSTP
jgi:hypothetical protein